MGTRKILTIGIQLASSAAEYKRFDSRTSLLDWDIIVLSLDIDLFLGRGDPFQGRPCLSDDNSLQLKESCDHWRREMEEACAAGKTVIVYLSPLEMVYVDSGRREYSGTGRSRSATRIVEEFDNYKAVPRALKPIDAKGTAMKLPPLGSEVLAPYWHTFGQQSTYEVVLSGAQIPACVLTKVGDRPVGALYRDETSGGSLLLLPNIDFDPPNFTKTTKKHGEEWTKAATRFADQFISAIVALDKALHSAAAVTPEPEWASDPGYVLLPEQELKARLLKAEQELEKAQKHKEKILEVLKGLGSFRGLLYENGKPLEAVIIESLKLFGFSAAPYKDSTSEFDSVFESNEGRLIGEAEGKDTKPINIDKLRQLSMNILEDLKRDSVSKPAKPVLFGNGYRLERPNQRPDPFTEKCKTSATSSSTALVATADMYAPVQYLLAVTDKDYATQCRKGLLEAVGRVTFPSPPKHAKSREGTKLREVAETKKEDDVK